MDWSKVDTVLLDMDGTLLDLHFDNHFWLEYLPGRYAEHLGLPLDTARTQLFDHMMSIEGTIDWYCLDYWSRALDFDVMAIKREVDHLIGFRPGAQRFLDALGVAGKRRLLVTNAHRDVLTLKLERTLLQEHVDELISAHDYHKPKEDPTFWDHLRADHPFDPSRSALIDDNPNVLRSARQYGIAHQLGIHQPDSKQPPRRWDDFEVVVDFADVMPG